MYLNFIKRNLILKEKFYNINKFPKLYGQVEFNFSTFTEKDLLIFNVFKIMEGFFDNNPKFIKLNSYYVYRNLLKKYVLAFYLNKNRFKNLFSYISYYYYYFFQLLSQNKLKINYTNTYILIYFDNPQIFLRNFEKFDYLIQFKFFIYSSNTIYFNLFVMFLKQFYIIK